MYLHTSLHYHTQYISGSQLLHCKCSTTTSLPKAAFSMIHNLPYSWYTYTPSKYSLHHASLKCIQEDWLPSTIDFNSKVKARLQIQKVIHSLPLLFFSFVQNSRSICVAFIFLSRNMHWYTVQWVKHDVGRSLWVLSKIMRKWKSVIKDSIYIE